MGKVLIECEARSRPASQRTPSFFGGRVGEGGRRLLGAILVLLAILFAAPVLAEEAITSFTTDVTLRVDGSVNVTETVQVNAEGWEIRRGIFRDIFVTMVNADNSRLRSSLNVISVERNGRPEPYAVETVTTGIKRIRIGDADVFLDYGLHTYKIRYTMSRMGRFFADHDELYWNATGNYWSFPIRRAVTNITLPPGAVISDLAGYTGAVGSTERAVWPRLRLRVGTRRQPRSTCPSCLTTIAKISLASAAAWGSGDENTRPTAYDPAAGSSASGVLVSGVRIRPWAHSRSNSAWGI